MRMRLANEEYWIDPSFFAEIMALCALASVRAGDGLLPDHPKASRFFEAAESVMPSDLDHMVGLGWMRTCATLALYGIHTAKLSELHKYVNLYGTIVSNHRLYIENEWPIYISVTEVEMRRRLATESFQRGCIMN